MSIDYQVVRDLERSYASLVQDQAELMIYMPRYAESNNPFGFCGRCYDDRTEQVTDALCPICFGTGFTGGYDIPITGIDAPYQRVHGILSPNVFVTDWQSSGPISNEQNQKIYFKMDLQPTLSDLVIDSQGNRYRIGTEGVDWSFNNIRVGWIAVVFQMPPDSIVYQVPIPVKLSEIRFNSRSRVEMEFLLEENLANTFNA